MSEVWRSIYATYNKQGGEGGEVAGPRSEMSKSYRCHYIIHFWRIKSRRWLTVGGGLNRLSILL